MFLWEFFAFELFDVTNQCSVKVNVKVKVNEVDCSPKSSLCLSYMVSPIIVKVTVKVKVNEFDCSSKSCFCV